MTSAFNSQILVEKLVKLNHTQQSIETLSHWCIFHRRKAAEIVDTWERQFHETPRELQIPFLYLANDILQNSRRKGGEFVHEFWRVLPVALKTVIQNRDEKRCNAVFRLVDIWEERKVFGSRVQSLREELLGKDMVVETIDIAMKDNYHAKTGYSVGGLQEKLSAAYRYVQDVASDEDTILGRCNIAAIRIEGLGREADVLQKTGGPQEVASLANEVEEQQNILANCVDQLEISEGARAGLIEYLKEALCEQESKFGLIRNQLQIAQAQLEYASKVRKQLLSCTLNRDDTTEQCGYEETSSPEMDDGPPIASTGVVDMGREKLATSLEYLVPVEDSKGGAGGEDDDGDDEPKKSAAAEIAAKLAASTSSAQMLTSALSSLAAEEATSSRMLSVPIDGSLSPPSIPEKRRRLDESPQPPPYVPPLPSVSFVVSPPIHQNASSPSLPPPPPPPPLPQPQPQPNYMPNSLGVMNAPYRGWVPPPIAHARPLSHPVVPMGQAHMPPPTLPPAASYQVQRPPPAGARFYYPRPPLPYATVPWNC